MRLKTQRQIFVSCLLTCCLLLLPITAMAKKGEKNFNRGMRYEQAQQWEKAAQEFMLAVAANPADVEYQLHFRRASFNASQSFMQQGRALAEMRDYVGAYNAFRQAYGYDSVNELAVSEMERMLRLQSVKEGTNGSANGHGSKNGELPDSGTLTTSGAQVEEPVVVPSSRVEQLRVISYSGDLKAFVRSLAEQLQLNVVFDRQSFAQPRTIDINLRDVTTAQALDYIFLQEGLFFQKLSRRTILVADQTRRPQYQQLVLRTFFLSNMKPSDARTLIQQAIPPSVGRPQTIVVPDDATNSLTVRDTAENVRLIGDLLASIDKDRAEVVMDVAIYEVSKTDLLKLGNQIGQEALNSIGGSPGFSLLSGAGTLGQGTPGVNLSGIVGNVPTALAAALVFPQSTLWAFQAKGNTKLIAHTQVHAFNGEESTARIGQRVPVQTAQAYPFGIQTGQPAQGTNFPTGGFPVINYEPTGLTLKFTPQVFTNLDVQVKMTIESKDVLASADPLTPTFTERTITGTARVQNNRTMMLASIRSQSESNGRRGLPLIGLIPVLGRLFTAPTRDVRDIDVVIAVTPRVLRAPAVTPRDEEMRPSGTLQSPTTGSLEAMIIESDREEQIAAARRLPKSPVVRLPDMEPPPFGRAASSAELARNTQPVAPAPTATAVTQTKTENTGAVAQTKPETTVASTPAQPKTKPQAVEELPAFVPAPKSLVSDRSAAEVAVVNSGIGGTQNAAKTSLTTPIDASATSTRKGLRTAQLKLTPANEVLSVGDKRRYALEFTSDVALSLAVISLKFDPKVVKVTAVSYGTVFPNAKSPMLTQSVDPSGRCLISIAANSGGLMQGAGSLVFLQVEAIGAGDTGLTFDKGNMHL
ncbi:MAG TPA: secretin N-terminal domain-containing protein, partial [Pyrinomonadaceae bacterium]|nr:secretin N-terminal domain-containing protein [Pyrinomonadaceae bacterium]